MKTRNQKKGFTIVELLVVIVVIGILAAITIVSYNGITDRANNTKGIAAAKAVQDFVNAYYAENGSYPKSESEIEENNFTLVRLPSNLITVTTELNKNSTTSSRVEVKYGYCANGYVVEYFDVVKNDSKTLTEGTCSTEPTFIPITD